MRNGFQEDRGKGSSKNGRVLVIINSEREKKNVKQYKASYANGRNRQKQILILGYHGIQRATGRGKMEPVCILF